MVYKTFFSDSLRYLHYINPWKPLEMDVSFLTNKHDCSEDFLFQTETLNKYFNSTLDVLLIEAPENTEYFEIKKKKFMDKCPTVQYVMGWADYSAFQEAIYLKNKLRDFEQLKCLDSTDKKINDYVKSKLINITQDGSFLDGTTDKLTVKEARERLFECLSMYQSSLIRKIAECQRQGFRVFVDTGTLHVCPSTAIDNGFSDFLPQIDRLKTSLIGKRVLYFNPPNRLITQFGEQENVAATNSLVNRKQNYN